MADDVTVFYEGETIEQAKAADFENVENLRHPYTQALWHAMPEHGFRVMPDPEDGKQVQRDNKNESGTDV